MLNDRTLQCIPGHPYAHTCMAMMRPLCSQARRSRCRFTACRSADVLGSYLQVLGRYSKC